MRGKSAVALLASGSQLLEEAAVRFAMRHDSSDGKGGESSGDRLRRGYGEQFNGERQTPAPSTSLKVRNDKQKGEAKATADW